MIFDRDILVKEIVFQYDFTIDHANNIVDRYEENDNYEYLCELVKNHANIV